MLSPVKLHMEEVIPPTPLTVEDKIELAFGEDASLMKEVAYAESRMNTNAINPEWHNGCQGSYGLFQVACVNYAGDSRDLLNEDINIEVAKRVYDTQGIYAWGVCHNGAVDCS